MPSYPTFVASTAIGVTVFCDMECNKCLHTIDRKTDRYTICEGRCAKRYHAACVGLAESTVCALFTKNILWMCDACLADYCLTRDAESPLEATIDDNSMSRENSIESEIACLKSKIEEITETLAAIVPYQRHFVDKQHSTPISPSSSYHLMNGTKISSLNDANAGATTYDRTVCSNTFSLFVTNVVCSATEEDVRQLVCECLDILDPNTIGVRKLVKMRQLNDTMDFISFKVVLDLKLKPLALQQTTWPIGLKYREFENRRTVWAPKSVVK